MPHHVVLATNIYSFFRSFLRWLNVLMTLYFNRMRGSLVRSFIHPFFHPSTHATTFYLCFFSLNFRSRTLLPPRRDLWKRKRCWSRHRRGTDRPQPLLWQPLRNRVVRWYFMSVAESVHLRSNGLQCNKLNQGLPKFNWPMTAYVRNEGGCLKLSMVPVGFLRCTVTIDEFPNDLDN